MARSVKKRAQTKERDNGPKWHDGIPALVRSLAGRSKKGLTDQEVADAVGAANGGRPCTVRTIHRWKKEHPEFCKALIETKAIMDARVEMSLYQRALGAQTTKVEVTIVGGQETRRVVKTEDVPPDITAIRLWLTNRAPGQWRDKMDLEHSGAIKIEDARAALLARISALAPEETREQ